VARACLLQTRERVILDDYSAGQEKPPGRAQRQLLMDGTAVKSAFALLSTKVTKLMRRIQR